MRKYVAILFLLFGLCPVDTSAANEVARLTIYAALERDLCPVGYASSSSCGLFTADRFEDLLNKRRLMPIGETIMLRLAGGSAEQKVLISSAHVASRGRKAARESGLAALLVIEWVESAADQLSEFSANRRAFDHASMQSLAPEAGRVWSFRRGHARILLEIR